MDDPNMSWDALERLGAPIWENLYHVRVPTYATYTDQRLRDIGRPSTGNRRVDEEHLKEPCEVYITIDKIVEHYRIGTPVVFCKNNDLIEIYRIVDAYLRFWAKQIRNGLHHLAAPVDDLLLLDQFASDVMMQSQIFNGEIAKPSLGALGEMMRKTLMGSLNQSNQANQDLVVKQHESVAHLFTEAATRERQHLEGASSPDDVMSRWK